MHHRFTRRTLFLGSTTAALCGQKTPKLSGEDDPLLDDLARRCFPYFWEQADPQTGIARDRSHADANEYPDDGRYVGSTGATGFALTGLCIGAQRGWSSRGEARARRAFRLARIEEA